MAQEGLVERHLRPVVEELLGDLRVLIINGPRQCGKTTLLRQLQAVHGGAYYTLDQPEVHRFARDDPTGLVRDAARPTFIDEVQRGGDDLIRAIKIAVDEDTRPGRFVLSGSSRFLTVPTLSESLVGRASVLELWPLSAAELAGARPQIVDRLLSDPAALRGLPESTYSRLDYLRLACSGGFPELLRARSPRGRANWFKGYLDTLVQRDIRDLTQIRQSADLPRLLTLLAGRTAQTIRISPIADALGWDPATLARYLPLLEQVYLIHHLPAWSNNQTSRATRTPKMHFVDTGVVARLLNRSAQSLAEPGNADGGAIFETFIVNELMKQAGTAESEVQLFHYRDRDGGEIDCVLETSDRRIVGIEAKLAMSANEADFRHLRAMRDRQGERFVCGVLVYCGQHAIPFGDRLYALPASALWSGQPMPASLP